MMTQESYSKALEDAIAEYDRIKARESEITAESAENKSRMATLKQTISSLNVLLGDESTPLILGFTDAIRQVLRQARFPANPKQVRDQLERIGFDLSKYDNEMASVHTILKRLVKQGEAIYATFGDDEKIDGYFPKDKELPDGFRRLEK